MPVFDCWGQELKREVKSTHPMIPFNLLILQDGWTETLTHRAAGNAHELHASQHDSEESSKM